MARTPTAFLVFVVLSSMSCYICPAANLRQPSSSTLVIGYSHDPGGRKVIAALKEGINVICWSFLHLVADKSSGEPVMQTDLDLAAIKLIRDTNKYKTVLHMAAIGGWNAPHPAPGFSGEQWAEVFATFNQQNGNIFDGVDWDLEGHDDRTASTSSFTTETLNVMADMSKILKQRYGYVISMAPAESYLDVVATDDVFSLDLNLFPQHWPKEHRQIVEKYNFAHAGRQCYAYVIHRAGIDTFDWVSLQLYESFSRFLYESTIVSKHDGADTTTAQLQLNALRRRAVAATHGFEIDLPNYGKIKIQIPSWKLVWGFANGWADGIKVVKVDQEMLSRLFVARLNTKGVMFWTIEEEGSGGLYLSKVINKSLQRSKKEWHHHIDEETDPGKKYSDEL